METLGSYLCRKISLFVFKMQPIQQGSGHLLSKLRSRCMALYSSEIWVIHQMPSQEISFSFSMGLCFSTIRKLNLKIKFSHI